jgi:methionyl-tRNA formyltransferase
MPDPKMADPKMARPLNVVLVAEEAIGARALGLVAARGHRTVYAVTSDGPAAPTAAAAHAAAVPVLPPEAAADPGFPDLLRAGSVDLLLNVHSLVIVRPEVLRAPRIGSFNLHPGPLPRYAGLNAPSWAIYRGERAFGCTVHWMEAEVDAGPIAYAAEFPITPTETGLSLSVKCAREGLRLLSELLAAAASDGAIPARPQDPAARTYFRREPPNGGAVDWSGPAVSVERFVRASDFHPFASPWDPAPRTWTETGDEVRILRATATPDQPELPPGSVAPCIGDSVLIAAADAWVEVDRVLIDGAVIAANAVLRPGTVLSSRN